MKQAILWFMMLLLIPAATSCAHKGGDEAPAAERYAERLNGGEAIEAEEYSRMVSLYCAEMNRCFAELETPARAHAEALAAADADAAAKTEAELRRRVAELEKNPAVGLGDALMKHLGQMPDTTAARLINYVSGLYSRCASF